ncbi:nodulation protein NopC [Mesorhizobium amorphae]|nr:nodulation protein NopC [Mesorhizobium amorphae]
MVGAVGGVGGIGASLARAGHGNTNLPHPGHGDGQHAPSEKPDNSRPGGARDRDDGGSSISTDGPSAATSSDGPSGATQAQAFEAAIRSVALQIVNDAMADMDDVMEETETEEGS